MPEKKPEKKPADAKKAEDGPFKIKEMVGGPDSIPEFLKKKEPKMVEEEKK